MTFANANMTGRNVDEVSKDVDGVLKRLHMRSGRRALARARWAWPRRRICMSYQQPFVVLEAGAEAGAAVREWGHVAHVLAVALHGRWRGARACSKSTAGSAAGRRACCRPATSWSTSYVQPLAGHPAIAPHVRFNARVAAVGRKDFDKVRTKGRDAAAVRGAARDRRDDRGARRDRCQRHVAAAESGGLGRRRGRRASASMRDRIAYGIPDVAGARARALCRQARARRRQRPLGVQRHPRPADAGRRGAGHATSSWAMRRENLDTVWGGGAVGCARSARRTGRSARSGRSRPGASRVLTPLSHSRDRQRPATR